MHFDTMFLEHFDKADQPLHGLPGGAYTDKKYFDLEQTQLFNQNWVFAGYAHQLAKAGDFRPIEVAGLPLFLLHGANGKISAYHNVCRHRNLKLIDANGNAGRMIRCPYHSWSYDLCGKLRNTPFFGGGIRELPGNFRYEDYGLVSVHCQVWYDWIFINLASQPSCFDEFLAPLKRQLGETDVTEFKPVAMLDFGVVNCNWKLLMENFIEPYHVQFVHKATTDQPLVNHHTLVDGNCLGSTVKLGEKQLNKSREGTLGVSSHYLTLFPNFVLGTYEPDQLGVHLNTPVTIDGTGQTRAIYIHKNSQYSDDQIQHLVDLWHSVHLEDHEMCIRLQQGRHSPVANDGGLLSPNWEDSLRKFQELVADAIRPKLTQTD